MTSQGHIFRERDEREGGAPAVTDAPDPGERLGGDDERVVVCRACRSPVTTRAQAIVVDGSHQHTFFNPAGVAYEIGCFSGASGCASAGRPTSEFTWFAGYRWSFALCLGCGVLLGWRFTGAAGGFWGLIVSRLADEERSAGE